MYILPQNNDATDDGDDNANKNYLDDENGEGKR